MVSLQHSVAETSRNQRAINREGCDGSDPTSSRLMGKVSPARSVSRTVDQPMRHWRSKSKLKQTQNQPVVPRLRRHALWRNLFHCSARSWPGLHRRSIKAFTTTLTLLDAIAAPASIGFSIPRAASGIPTRL